MIPELQIPKDLPTFADKRGARMKIQNVYASYEILVEEFGWDLSLVYNLQGTLTDGSPVTLPIVCLTTPKQGLAVWSFAGIHGEEPAGVNAIAKKVNFLGKLGQKIPIVLFPFCNPIGYFKDWRYFDEYRDSKKGHSVGDSEHLLLDESGQKPRYEEPSSRAAVALTSKVIGLLPSFPPLFSIDHHEDEDMKTKNKHRQSYIYSHGVEGTDDEIARIIVDILSRTKMPVTLSGETRFGEEIHNGIVVSRDGSIDEFMTAEKVFHRGAVAEKIAAVSAIAIETPTVRVPLSQRVRVHEEIIDSYPEFLDLRLRQETAISLSS